MISVRSLSSNAVTIGIGLVTQLAYLYFDSDNILKNWTRGGMVKYGGRKNKISNELNQLLYIIAERVKIPGELNHLLCITIHHPTH